MGKRMVVVVLNKLVPHYCGKGEQAPNALLNGNRVRMSVHASIHV